MWLELLKSKDEAFASFKKVKAAVESESGKHLKALRTDRGGEFNSGVFTVYCNEHGIKHNRIAPWTPQQNGVVKRRNQSVVEMARCLLKSMQVPGRFWGEAVTVAVYLLNRAPTKSLNGKTPFEAWFGKKPGVRHLRTFGCMAYAKKLGPGVSKLSDRSIPGVFLGYEQGSKAYRIYDPVNNKLIVSRDVLFDEKKSWNWGEKRTGTVDTAATETAPSFSVFYPDEPQATVADPTTEDDDDLVDQFEPASPVHSIPAQGGNGDESPHTPVPSFGGSNGGNLVQ